MLRFHQDHAQTEGLSLNPTTVPAPIPTCASLTGLVKKHDTQLTEGNEQELLLCCSYNYTFSSLAFRSVPLARQGAAGLEQLSVHSAEHCGHGAQLGAAPSAARSPAGSESSAQSQETQRPRGSVLSMGWR